MLLAALPVVFVLRERFSSHVYLLALVIALPLAASFAYEYAPYYNVSSTTDQRLILMHLALRLTAASVVAALVFRLLPTIDTRESLGRSYAYALFFAPILVASIGYLLDFEAASDWIFWVGVCGAGIGLISMSHYTRGKSNGRELPYLLIAIFWGGVGSSLSWTVFS
jgi:aminopeptidase-like protein